MSTIDDIARAHWELVEKVSKEVSHEFASPVGLRGFGYEVAHWEDVQGRVWAKLVELGPERVAELLKPDPRLEGRIREFARHAAYREVEGARASERAYVLEDGSTRRLRRTILAAFDDAIIDPPSTLGLPEPYLLEAEFDEALEDLARGLIATAPARFQAALRLYYLAGLDARSIASLVGKKYGAAREHLSQANRALPPEVVASLQNVREALHPSAKRPKAVGAEPTVLREWYERRSPS